MTEAMRRAQYLYAAGGAVLSDVLIESRLSVMSSVCRCIVGTPAAVHIITSVVMDLGSSINYNPVTLVIVLTAQCCYQDRKTRFY